MVIYLHLSTQTVVNKRRKWIMRILTRVSSNHRQLNLDRLGILRTISIIILFFGGTGQLVAQTTIFSDDFEDASIDINKWVQVTGAGTVTESGGYLKLNYRSGTAPHAQIRTKYDLMHENVTIKLRIKPVYVAGNKNIAFWLGDINTGSVTGFACEFHTTGQYIFQCCKYYQYDGWDGGTVPLTEHISKVWASSSDFYALHEVVITKEGSTYTFSIDGEQFAQDTAQTTQPTSLYFSLGRAWMEYRTGEYGEVWLDEITVQDLSPHIEISIDSLAATLGDTVDVPIKVGFPADSTCSSAEITLAGYQNGLDFIDIISDSSLTGDAGWTYAVNETDSLLITWSAGAQDISGSGVFCWLKFAVTGNPCTFVPINIISALFNTGTNPVTITNGGVNIEPIPAYGDVDENGMIQAYDASLILKHVIGVDTLICQGLANANVSLDTTISAFDASLILQYGVGLIDTLPYDTSNGFLLATGNIGMNDGEVQAGQLVEIPLYLANGNNILSFEGNITFNPEHLALEEVIWTELLAGFYVESNQENSEIKIAGASSVPDGQEGLFATLRFVVNENFNEDQTIVTVEQLRWNENERMANVATATLLRSLATDGNLSGIPSEFAISQNYPNPFNPVTSISYQLPRSTHVELSVYNIVGQLVETLLNEPKNAGYHTVTWDASGVGSGVYFYRIKAGDFSTVKKCVVLK